MSQKMKSIYTAAEHMRSGINKLLRATVKPGIPPSQADADMTTLRTRLLAQQEVLDDLLDLMHYRHNGVVWKAAYRRVYEEGDLRHNQAEKIHEDRLAYYANLES